MAVAFDSKGTKFEAAPATSFTNSTHTIGAISNGVLVVFLQFDNGTPSSIVVKWDSTGTFQTMTQIGTKVSSDGLAKAYMFGLLAPHTGNKTLSVSWTGSAAYAGISASFSGADQAAFATTFKNLTSVASTPGSTGNYPTGGLAINTVSGDMAIFNGGGALGSFGSGGGLGTQLQFAATQVAGDSRYLAAVGTTTSPAGNENFASVPYCALGCAIAQVGGGGPSIPITMQLKY